MAKGNLFQGMARGKVGDVVFYRMNGIQMSRVRNRTPKNPRTNEQLYQRAVIATVMKAYSAGKEIFDHAYQGYTIGEGCMRRFNSLNTRILRSQLIADINEARPNNMAQARFVAPRSLTCTPLIGLQVSEGTLDQNLFVITRVDETLQHKFSIAANPNNNNTTVNEYLSALGIYAGDIFTFVRFAANKTKEIYTPSWTDNKYAVQYDTQFEFIRLIVKSNISDELALGTAKWSNIFDVEKSANAANINMNNAFTPGTEVTFTYTNSFPAGITQACIRSRLDIDLRSTAETYLVSTSPFGITSGYVLSVWQDEVEKVGVSELILEGGDGGGVPGTGAGDSPSYQPIDGMAYVEGQPSEIIMAPVNENPVPVPARHKGTRNNPR